MQSEYVVLEPFKLQDFRKHKLFTKNMETK